MRERWKQIGAVMAVISAAAGLPLAGAWVAGHDLRRLWDFPPRLESVELYPRFSWVAVGCVLVLLAALLAPWFRPRRTQSFYIGGRNSRVAVKDRLRRRAFLSLAWTLGWWTLAWTRLSWFSAAQLFTFFPLWLGFIFTVEAFTEFRGGTPLRRRSPRNWLGLFVVSALFWWLFEWLNRFVENWHYLGVEKFGPLSYAANASLCFSTVLPAVAGVRELLGTWPALQLRLANGPLWVWLTRPPAGFLLLALGGGGLFLTGVSPLFFYPMLWSGPLFLALGAGGLSRGAGFWKEMAEGDWREVASWASAALVCGFFWEFWNVRSLAKWIYTVPYVDRWHVFEMPLLGYSGYLPFGIECGLITNGIVGALKATRKR